MKIKLDFGSGYAPRPNYYTCDCTGQFGLDFYFNPKTYTIEDCPDGTFDEIRCRNVIHHIQDLPRLFQEFKRVLAPDGAIVIIEPTPEAYPANLFLDRLWYRGIIRREEVWFSPVWRDYIQELTKLQYSVILKLPVDNGLKTLMIFKNMNTIKEQLEKAGYDFAVAIATEAEVAAGAACGQLAIVNES